MPSQDIYEAQFVRTLFDDMAATYGITNFIASLGFCRRWRAQCVALASIRPGMTVYDLMTGMGECWHLINRRLQDDGKLVALDFSAAMCRRAQAQKTRMPRLDVKLVEQDFLRNTLPDASADRVISCFGLKTFSEAQQAVAAREIARLLKPGGLFSLLEISVPATVVLRGPYMGYLKYGIPLLGKLLLGNPDNYKMLGIYTEQFKDCGSMRQHLEQHGLEVEQRRFFFGCATALRGRKPGAL